MADAEITLPHWDMSVLYPDLDSPEYHAGFGSLQSSIDRLIELFDQHHIEQREMAAFDDATVHTFDLAATQYNQVLELTETLLSYVYGFVSTDSRDERAQAALSELQQQLVRLSLLGARWTAWIGSLDVETLIERSTLARDHAFMLRKACHQSRHLMSPAEEALAAELYVSGGAAWSKLYATWTSQIMVSLDLHGATEELPMSAVRNLASDPDRDVRQSAHQAELAAWRLAQVPIAAALNGIKGEMNTLTHHRGWESPLEVALFDNNIDQQTLDAMMTAMRDSFPDFRRYLHAKAQALGLPVLAWYDLFAPLGGVEATWSYEDAAAFIEAEFARYSPKLSDLAQRAFSQGWIDAEPRVGKSDGAFCMPLRGDESRILANFKPVFGEVATLAHELGHAYHNLNLAECTMLQRDTPMTLAETASIFCETLVRRAAFECAEPHEQLALLETSLQGSCQVVVDISSRFLFEQRVFDQRLQRDLSAEELNQIMIESQRETYGDGVDPETLHPYMWAAKSHYYGNPFYNFPYTFGLLFALGLYAQYQSDPGRFVARYDELLASTGLDAAAELTARFGIDIRSPEFWRSSLDVIRADIDRFVALVEQNKQA